MPDSIWSRYSLVMYCVRVSYWALLCVVVGVCCVVCCVVCCYGCVYIIWMEERTGRQGKRKEGGIGWQAEGRAEGDDKDKILIIMRGRKEKIYFS